jgi:hypothetical protein
MRPMHTRHDFGTSTTTVTNLRTANKDVGGEVVRLRAVQILVALIAALAVDRKGSNTPKGSVNQ